MLLSVEYIHQWILNLKVHSHVIIAEIFCIKATFLLQIHYDFVHCSSASIINYMYTKLTRSRFVVYSSSFYIFVTD